MTTIVKKSPDLPRVITPTRIADDRGWFCETFHEERLAEAGIVCRFVQENRSRSKRAGTLRGLHFQLPPHSQAKLFTVLRGRVFDVAVDIRRGSPTYGRFVSMELSADDGRLLYIPVGFAHGFCTLEDDTEISYKVSAYYAPLHEGGIRWDDPDIAIPWPVDPTAIILSRRDECLPLLREFQSPFPCDGHPLDLSLIPDGSRPQRKLA
jgi:dTDP-4-dehydrorhamnose 3,5-epimerase